MDQTILDRKDLIYIKLLKLKARVKEYNQKIANSLYDDVNYNRQILNDLDGSVDDLIVRFREVVDGNVSANNLVVTVQGIETDILNLMETKFVDMK
jgi:hypothetical protein